MAMSSVATFALFWLLLFPFLTTNRYVPGVAMTDLGRTATICVDEKFSKVSGRSLSVTDGD
jgi:hypothetical protein